MEFKVPHALKVEHDQLHHDLTLAIESGGQTGTAAQVVADALHAHFDGEEKYALQPLGLLPAIAEGKITPEMAQVLELTDTLKAEMPRMLEEHQVIVDALKRLIAAAKQEGKLQHADFAEKLMLHAQSEEEVAYPAALVMGEYLKLKLGRA